ncbi:MAG TPA: tetratricopeptide repeat protein [Planctomycetota bacterium]|jgi:pentatricopeptide repeat protein
MKSSVVLIALATVMTFAGEAPQPTPGPATGQPKPAAAATQPGTPPAKVAVPSVLTPAMPNMPALQPPGTLRLPAAGQRGADPGVQTAEAAKADPAYLNDLAQVHLRYGVLEAAEPLLKEALDKYKDAAQKRQVFGSLASVYQRKGDWKGAAELYEKALSGATNPSEKIRLVTSLADACANAGNFEKAEKVLTEAIESGEQSPMGQYQRQEAQRQLARIWDRQPGRIEKVIEENEKAVQADPKNVAAIERLADIYSRPKGNPEKASEWCEKLLALRPDDKNLQNRLMNQYQIGRQFDKAAELGQKLFAAAKTDADKRTHAFQIAQLLLSGGKKTEAGKWLQQNFPKQNAAGYELTSLSMFFDQAGMEGEAEEALLEACASAKSQSEKAESQLRLVDLQTRHQQYAKADALLKTVLAESKNNESVVQRANSALDRLRRLQLAQTQQAQVQAQPTGANQAQTPPGQGQPVPVLPPMAPEKK